MLLVALGARTVVGLFLGVIFSFVGWMIAWTVHALPTTAMFEVVTVLSIGGSAGVAAVLAWWNPARPNRVTALHVTLTIGAAMLSSWIAYEMAVTSARSTFLGESILLPMMYGSVLGGNLIASGISAYRAVRHREV